MTIPFSHVDMSVFLTSGYKQNMFIMNNSKRWRDIKLKTKFTGKCQMRHYC